MISQAEMKKKEPIKIPWSKSVWFFDIDDTLIDTAGTTLDASKGIREVFEARFDPEIAKSVQQHFNDIFNLMLAGYRVKSDEDWKDVPGGKRGFDDLLTKIEDHQTEVMEKYGAIKKWSREVFIKLAADRAAIKVTPELIHEAADAYWIALTERTQLFPHVLDLFQEIRAHDRPVYLITSSDARLKMRESGQFAYIPEYSEGLKRERIELLREKGLQFRSVSIGDPEDKPHLDFFEKGIRMAEEDIGESINLSDALMFGDSYAGDLETPKEQLGFGIVVLFNQGQAATTLEDEHFITTGNIASVTEYLY